MIHTNQEEKTETERDKNYRQEIVTSWRRLQANHCSLFLLTLTIYYGSVQPKADLFHVSIETLNTSQTIQFVTSSLIGRPTCNSIVTSYWFFFVGLAGDHRT